jgi:hypothetical protein
MLDNVSTLKRFRLVDFRAIRRDWVGDLDAITIVTSHCSETLRRYSFAVVLTRPFGAMSRLGRTIERGKVDKSAVYACGTERRDYHLSAKHYSYVR